jgi:hypothetical protein
MTSSFKLSDKVALGPDTNDRMGRSWVGWSPDLTGEEVYENNRGIWILGRLAHAE